MSAWWFVVAGVVALYAVWVIAEALLDRRERFDAGPEPDAAAFVRVGPTVLPDGGYKTPREELSALSSEAIELLLDAHYREVLVSKDGRRMWRKLLADAAAVERYAKVGH
jgi:hypothetical protein